MLQAMNTGHEGSLTTVHANTPRDVLSRLEVLTLMGGVDLPLAAIREQIASALDLIIHQSRFRDGSRRITSVTEVTGIESGRVQTQELFRFVSSRAARWRHRAARHVACGAIPSFHEALVERGVAMDLSLFREAPMNGSWRRRVGAAVAADGRAWLCWLRWCWRCSALRYGGAAAGSRYRPPLHRRRRPPA